MPSDDDHDDLPRGRPLPPEDRLWRHPSEMGETTGQSRIVVIEKPANSGGRTFLVGMASLLLGAGGATGVLLGTEVLVRERPGATSREVRDVSPGSPGANEIAIAETALESVARIETSGGPRGPVNATAVIFRSDGQLITTADAIDGAEQITVVLRSGRRLTTPEVTVVGKSIDADVAVLQIPVADLPVAAGTKRRVKFGEQTVLIDASPTTRGPTIAVGVVTREIAQINRESKPPVYGLVETTTQANVSTSGAGTIFLDDLGSVVGLVTGRAEIAANPTTGTTRNSAGASRVGLNGSGDGDKAMHYALPADYVWNVAAQIADDHQVVKPWLGLPRGEDITVDEANRDRIQGGMRVTMVEDNSPARQVGIQLGDVVVALGGDNVRSYNEFVTAQRRQLPGSDVTVTVLHRGDYVQKLVRVGRKAEQ